MYIKIRLFPNASCMYSFFSLHRIMNLSFKVIALVHVNLGIIFIINMCNLERHIIGMGGSNKYRGRRFLKRVYNWQRINKAKHMRVRL